jgi:hypothetical protein
MPIRKYIPGSAFDPETVAHMVTAFETLSLILNLDPNDPLVETVAKKIISLASQGVTDPDEIIRQIIADADPL